MSYKAKPINEPLLASEQARFWSKVKKSDGCWMWTAGKTDRGYGTFTIRRLFRNGIKAHRVSYFLTYGNIPPSMSICHRCDVPGCVNPAHLFLGTHKDNCADMAAKGRAASGESWRAKCRIHAPRGESHSCAKLTERQVMMMRAAYRDGDSSSQIGARFGVSKQNTLALVTGHTWSHLPVYPKRIVCQQVARIMRRPARRRARP